MGHSPLNPGEMGHYIQRCKPITLATADSRTQKGQNTKRESRRGNSIYSRCIYKGSFRQETESNPGFSRKTPISKTWFLQIGKHYISVQNIGERTSLWQISAKHLSLQKFLVLADIKDEKYVSIWVNLKFKLLSNCDLLIQLNESTVSCTISYSLSSPTWKTRIWYNEASPAGRQGDR